MIRRRCRHRYLNGGRQAARALSWVSLLRITGEGILGLVAGAAAGSISLIGWALGSAIEGLAIDIAGIEAPDTRPVFLAALGVHVSAGATAVITGALAATPRKHVGRHPRAGTAYLWALATVFATASVLAGMRWHHDAHLFAIATVALGFGLFGWRARLRQRPGLVRRHAIGIGGSYIALLTGFDVDNGPQLPVWDRLPHPMYWLLPTAVGAPLIWLALRRFRSGVSVRPRTATRANVRR